MIVYEPHVGSTRVNGYMLDDLRVVVVALRPNRTHHTNQSLLSGCGALNSLGDQVAEHVK